MARPDEIRENARNAMETIDSNEDLKLIREQFPTLSEQQIKQWHIPAVINYAENLRRAIREDDLVTMRRYKNTERFLESFSAAASKIKNPDSQQKINRNLTACDPENVEDFEKDLSEEQGEECSETEQNEGIQLTLF